MTKKEIISYLAELDLATLERLKKYADYLVIPDEDLLVNVTMTQMVDKGHELADVLFSEWTDRSKSDFGEFLLELFALFSEKDFWYLNAFANDSVLRKARSYSNAFSKASSMGYQAKTCKGATASFTVTFAAGSEMTYERGELIVEADGYKFSNDSSFTVEESSDETSVVVELSQGTQYSEDVSFNGYCIVLKQENIDIDSISITIGSVQYERRSNFGYSGEASTHFMVLPEEDGSCSIYFGSNGYGVTPDIGTTVTVEYRVCDGSDANMEITEDCEINDSLSDREATAVEMTTSATGGAYADSLTAIKEKTSNYFATKGIVVNESTAESLLEDLSYIYKAKVILVGNTITYRVIPTSGLPEPTTDEQSSLEEDFEPYIPMGFEAQYTANNYKNVLVMANSSAEYILLDVVISTGYSTSTIEESIRQILKDMTNPLISAEYGGSFTQTDVNLTIRSKVAGVLSVSLYTVAGTTETIMPDITLEEDTIFHEISDDEMQFRFTTN